MSPLAAVVGLRAAYGRRRHVLAAGLGFEAEIAATRDVVAATARFYGSVPPGKPRTVLVDALAAEDEYLRWGLAQPRGGGVPCGVASSAAREPVEAQRSGRRAGGHHPRDRSEGFVMDEFADIDPLFGAKPTWRLDPDDDPLFYGWPAAPDDTRPIPRLTAVA